MKSLLIAIKPKWCAKIMNGEKTIEVRKSMPKCDLPIDVYIYCTKEDSLSILKTYPKDTYVCEQEFKCDDFPYLCSGYEGKGKVVAKFTLNKVEEIKYHFGYYDMGEWTETYIKEKSCLTSKELDNYLKASEEYNAKKPSKVYGYAWHISNLEIFDKPKELSEFYKVGYLDYIKPREHPRNPETYKDFYKDVLQVAKFYFKLTKAPQSWGYCEYVETKA